MKIMKQLSGRGLFLPAIALCSLLAVAGPSEASLVTFSFDGSIGEVGGVLFPTLGTGSMSGTVTFDSATDPVVPGTGIYLNSITALNLNVNGRPFSYAPGANGIVIMNSPPMGGSDSVTAFSSVTGMAINGVIPTSFQVSLSDPSGRVFSDLSLTTTPPSLNSFARNQWRLNFSGVGNYVVGSLAHLTAVPLPAAVLLFGAGLISLVGLGAGGLRNLRRPHQA
ncbi:MAG TPA: hypothetical protein VK901_19335 [Nitrospiraceae bacterium]|nr:hypothetical protein [Nitrospiraceae bacterium]